MAEHKGQCDGFGAVSGDPHVPQRRAAAEGLRSLAIIQHRLWHLVRVRDVWEELWDRFNTEFEMMVRTCCEAARSGENPRLPVLAWAAHRLPGFRRRPATVATLLTP